MGCYIILIMKINVRCVYNYRYSASANRSCSMSTLYCLSMMEKHSLPSVKMSCVLFNVKFNLFLFLWETIESKMSNIECKSLPTYLSSRNFISYETRPLNCRHSWSWFSFFHLLVSWLAVQIDFLKILNENAF